MRAGMLRRRISIAKKTGTRDAFGAVSDSWTTVLNTFASVEPVSDRERIEAESVFADRTHRIRIRRPPGTNIDTAMRITWGTRTFNILSIVDPWERGRELVIMAAEVRK